MKRTRRTQKQSRTTLDEIRDISLFRHVLTGMISALIVRRELIVWVQGYNVIVEVVDIAINGNAIQLKLDDGFKFKLERDDDVTHES